MDAVSFRKAQPGDLAIMQDIARRTIDGSYRSFLGDEGVDSFIGSGESDRELQKHIESCDVALREDAIVGFAIYFDDLIHLMMIDVRLHRNGIGSLLLAHTESQLFARGHKTIRLETFEGNHQAINFYVMNGWIVTTKSKDEAYGFVRIYFEKQVRRS
jgi:ribosomal protein S18 acetylase RimI-like enzyme